MRKRGWSRAGRLIAVVMTLMLCVPGAFAQDDEPQAPFDVQGRKHHTNWVAWTASFLFAVGVVLIAFKNPHRSHLD